jgi:CheY-like chemotaxis protein
MVPITHNRGISMTKNAQSTERAADVAAQLPFLRRYARALTGSQDSGDRLAMATLQLVLDDPSAIREGGTIRVGLFAILHGIWTETGAAHDPQIAPLALLEARAQWRLAGLTTGSREALLLNAIEGFSVPDIARIMDQPQDAVTDLIAQAHDDITEMVAGDILIIEDEAIIAMDLQAIVTDMGHRVNGVARTRDTAIRMGGAQRPDLILADIQLADNSSGIDAVKALWRDLGDVPVIFITAFPERLLTGERPEPAFLITKPYAGDQVRTAVSQAMFFASTESLREAG